MLLFFSLIDIPIAVIYPALSREWREKAYCYQTTAADANASLADDNNNIEGSAGKRMEYLYVGRMEAEKCPGLLLKAMAYIHSL